MREAIKLFSFSAQDIWKQSHAPSYYAKHFQITKKKVDEYAKLEEDLARILNSYSEILVTNILTMQSSCTKKDNLLFIGNQRFQFMRQKNPPYLCLTDFFEDEDSVVLFIASISECVGRKAKELYKNGELLDSHILSTLSLFLVEHSLKLLPYKGKPFSFGHSSCPELENHIPLFHLLNPQKLLNISLTENLMMVPQTSVSGMIIHNEKAHYFLAKDF